MAIKTPVEPPFDFRGGFAGVLVAAENFTAGGFFISSEALHFVCRALARRGAADKNAVRS